MTNQNEYDDEADDESNGANGQESDNEYQDNN